MNEFLIDMLLNRFNIFCIGMLCGMAAYMLHPRVKIMPKVEKRGRRCRICRNRVGRACNRDWKPVELEGTCEYFRLGYIEVKGKMEKPKLKEITPGQSIIEMINVMSYNHKMMTDYTEYLEEENKRLKEKRSK